MKAAGTLFIVFCILATPLCAEAAPKHYKIGAILSTSGALASLGVVVRNGAFLALEEVNQKYPFQVELVVEDDRSNATDAVSIARKFIDLGGIRAIIGPIRSNTVLAVAPITERYQVLLLSPIASSSEISQAGDFVFRNRESGGLHALEMARFLARRKLTRVALFSADSANSLTYTQEFKRHFPALGGSVVYAVDYDPGGQDFYTEIAKAKGSNPDALYISSAGGIDAGILIKQLRQSGLNAPIFGTPAFSLQDVVKAAGESANGVVFTAPAFDPEDPKIRGFTEAYQKKFGIRSDVFAANAYDAMMLLAQAIKSCGGDDSACLRDYLYAVRDYPGVSGITSFDKNGDVTKPIDFYIIQNEQTLKYQPSP
jgi:branched-chain amino acid transport system substrate-binding protein